MSAAPFVPWYERPEYAERYAEMQKNPEVMRVKAYMENLIATTQGPRKAAKPAAAEAAPVPDPPVENADAAGYVIPKAKNAAKGIFLSSTGPDGEAHVWPDGKKAEYKSHNAAAADLKKRGYHRVHQSTIGRVLASGTKELRAEHAQGAVVFWVATCE